MFVNQHAPASREPEPMAREGFEARSKMPAGCEMAGRAAIGDDEAGAPLDFVLVRRKGLTC